MQLSRCGAEHIPLVSTLEAGILTTVVHNVQVAQLVMGCHECIRACPSVFLFIRPESGDLEQAADCIAWPVADPARFLTVTRHLEF